MATYDAQIRIKVANLNQLKKLEDRVNRVQNALQGKSPTGKQAKANIAATSPELQKEKAVTKELKKQLRIRQQMKRTPGVAGGTGRGGKGGALSGALISGAFPLLFGQGPLGGLAGFTGGFIGGKVGGQMGGFAGGLIATAALTQVQQIIDGVTAVGNAFSKTNLDITQVTKSLGLVGTSSAKYLQLLEQTQGKQAAYNESIKRLTRIVGAEGVKNLQEFGDASRQFANDVSVLMTRLAAAFAGFANKLNKEGLLGLGGLSKFTKPFETSGILRKANLNESPEMASLIAQRDALTAGRTGRDLGNVKRSDEYKNIRSQIIELQKAQEATQKLNDVENSRAITLDNSIKSITDQNTFLQNQLTLGEQGARIEQEKLKFAKAQDIAVSDLTAKEAERIENAVKLNDKLKEQRAIQEQIQNILATGMTNAVMGLIEGTKTLGQVLADVAKQLASMFLNRAFSSIFGGLFGGGGGMSAGGYYSSTTGLGIAGPNFGLAEGGYVTSAGLKMIGEAGESEYVIPASKMDGAMSRYSAGARGGAVIPGGSGDSGTVAGGTGNAIVEYTGPVLNFNGDEYVPKSAVPEIIGAAVKRGAQAGKAQVLGSLKNSRSQRSSLGL